MPVVRIAARGVSHSTSLRVSAAALHRGSIDLPLPCSTLCGTSHSKSLQDSAFVGDKVGHDAGDTFTKKSKCADLTLMKQVLAILNRLILKDVRSTPPIPQTTVYNAPWCVSFGLSAVLCSIRESSCLCDRAASNGNEDKESDLAWIMVIVVDRE